MSWFRGTPRVREPVDCAEVARVLQHYLDDRLSAPDTAAIHEHLEACRMCGMEADAYRALQRSLRRRSELPNAAAERLRTFARDLGAVEEDDRRSR